MESPVIVDYYFLARLCVQDKNTDSHIGPSLFIGHSTDGDQCPHIAVPQYLVAPSLLDLGGDG